MAKLDEVNHYWTLGRKHHPKGGAGSPPISGKGSMPGISSAATATSIPLPGSRKDAQASASSYRAKVMRFQSRAYFFSFYDH